MSLILYLHSIPLQYNEDILIKLEIENNRLKKLSLWNDLVVSISYVFFLDH